MHTAVFFTGQMLYPLPKEQHQITRQTHHNSQNHNSGTHSHNAILYAGK